MLRRTRFALTLAVGLLLLPEAAQAALAYRRQITILGAQVGAVGTPHNDFPVLVSITDPTLRLTVNGGRMGHASAYDIAFRDSGLALLDWEVERYDGVTGTLIAWVRIPSLPAGAGNNTIIHLDYGDCTVSAPTNTPANVWNAYRYVYHMGQSGTANPVDSTSNAVSAVRNPTADAGMLNAYTAAGRIGGAIDLQVGPVVPPLNQFLPTTPTHVRVNDPNLALNTVFTMETWVRFDTVAGLFVGIQTKARESGTRWVGSDRVDTGLPSFIWQLPEGNVDGTTVMGAGAWYHVAVRYNGLDLRQIFVNGVLEGTSNTVIANATLALPTRLGDDSNGNYLDGQLDEVRMSSAIRAAGYIQTSFNNQNSPGTFYTVGPEAPIAATTTCGANGIPCASLGAAATTTSVTVTAPGSFEMKFDDSVGGGVQEFYDLVDDPGKTVDLAGGGSRQDALFLDEVDYTGFSYRSDKTRGRAELLESTPARVKVRSLGPFQRFGSLTNVPGLVGQGDYSVLPSGRMALRWIRGAGATVTVDFQQLHLNVRYAASGILSGWGGYTQSGPILLNGDTNPPSDQFVMMLLDQPTARTDFQMAIAANWPAANTTYADTNANQLWAENSWYDTTVGTGIPFGSIQRWDFLTWFKPTDVFDHLDARAVSRNADYRAPDVPAMAIGQGWFDTNEVTSPGDFFNEGESSYNFDLDPALGLRFDMNGLGTNRNRPFFKVRQWRSLSPPPTITVGGATRTRNVHYLAEVKPVTRAYWATNLAWHCDLEDTNPANTCQPGVNLDVGTGGSVNATTAVAGYFGNAVGFDANGDYVRAGSGSVLDFTENGGAVDFWYQPGSVHTDGARRILWMNSSGAGQDCFVFEKDAANALRFTIVVDGGNAACTLGGTTYTVAAASGAYAWQPGDWIHLKTTWETGLLQIFVNGRRLAFSGSYSAVNVTHGLTYFGGCPGACPLAGGNGNAFGVIDEPTIYTGSGQPRQVAQGGLLGSALEALGDTANNWSFNFDPVGSGGIGRYLYIGSESKFRGLNVILQAAGVGVAAGDLDWEYWNGGSWTNLETTPGFADGTNSFTKAGTLLWTADPAGWGAYPVDVGPLLFFVRAHLKATSAGYSAYPQERLIKTDILLLNYCADVTLNNQTFDISAPLPTAVEMLSFTAEPDQGAVDLAWETASEMHNLGFHLYRAEDVAGPFERITTSLIPGLGSSPTGARYSYRDGSLANGTTYYYRLEDWDTSGATKPHGPVWATPGQESGSVASGTEGGEGSGSSRLDYGDAAQNALRILERGPSHVVLELLTSGFTALSDGTGTVRLSVPGFDDSLDPGAPALPLRGAMLEAPVGRRARITSVEPSDLATFDGFRLAGTGTREVEVADTGALRPGRAPRPIAGATARGGYFPRHYARIVGSAFQGETKKLRLELAPLRHDVARGKTVLARRLVVRVEFFGKQDGERTLGGSRGRRPALPALRDKGVAAQLVLQGPGLYRVAFEGVFGAGRRGVPVSSLRLSHADADVAFHVEPARALFAPGSTLYWVARPAENPNGETVYELETGRPGTLMPVVNAAPSGPPVTEARAARAFEQNKYYQAALLEAPDLWLWDLLVSPVAKSYPFTVTRKAPSATAGTLRVVLQGATDFEADLDHHVRLSVNGSLVAETTWGGRRPTTVEGSLPPGLLVEGNNVLEVENVGDTAAAYSMVFLNRFEVSYPQRLEAEGGRFEAFFDAGGAALVAGLSGSARVVETTSMSWLTGTSSSGAALGFRAEPGRRYLAVDAAAVLTPQVRRSPGTSLRSTSHRADWILVGPSAFLAEAAPLLELRRRQGLIAKAVAVEDVFAQFGHGEPSAGAVRRFLEHAFQNWRKPSPRYVVLLGDSTYDPKDYLGTGVRDRVPTPVVQTSYLWTASDPTLAAVNGLDLVPDIALGRLPAKDVAEARRLVEKLVAFETAGRDLSGTAVLVADNADTAGAFEANADDLASTVLSGRTVEKVYLRDLGAATRATIRSAFDAGPGLVSYVGHGATAVWASENVWNNTDVATLAAQEKQPFLLTLNCLNGFFHFPPLDSLAEAFVKADGKGAIGAFAPSGLSVNDAAHVYHKALLAELESGRHERLGDAVLAAQSAYADSGAFPELLSIYHLFADPAMRIR